MKDNFQIENNKMKVINYNDFCTTWRKLQTQVIPKINIANLVS